MGGCGMDLCGLHYEPVVGCFVCNNETLGSVKQGNFLLSWENVSFSGRTVHVQPLARQKGKLPNLIKCWIENYARLPRNVIWPFVVIWHISLRRKACWGFFRPKKIRRLRPGANPRSWVPEASMLTTRPPKPLLFALTEKVCVFFVGIFGKGGKSCV
jgi:hypothetical protein